MQQPKACVGANPEPAQVDKPTSTIPRRDLSTPNRSSPTLRAFGTDRDFSRGIYNQIDARAHLIAPDAHTLTN